MAARTAFVTGITGQDGALLAELLLAKGYVVHGLKRRTSLLAMTSRLDHLCQDPHEPDPPLILHHGDMTDATGLVRLLQKIRPDEIYNLAAQSHVQVSFETPEYTADVDALGPLRLLEAIRILGLGRTRFYQASTSELYGLAQAVPQSETTPFYPRSPYAVAKLYGHWITVNYREAYGLHASNGILFNHEGTTRGETFVSRKITRAVAAIRAGRQDCLYLGNLEARRDWGDAADYVEGMWRILQQEQPDDYVLATGETHAVREFATLAFAEAGIDIGWSGRGADEIGIDRRSGDVRVRIDPRHVRPAEVELLAGDAAKARERLGWAPRTTFRELVAKMVRADMAALDAGSSGS